MKVKLLKKVRKRFSWHKDKDENIILVDHKKQDFHCIDNEFIQKRYSWTKEPECGWEQMKIRVLKELILSPYIHHPLNVLIYRRQSIKTGRKPNKTL